MVSLLFSIILANIAFTNAFYITKPTGKVICWHFNRQILSCTNEPGIHFYNPLVTQPQLVDVVLQTDTFGPIHCISKDRQVVKIPMITVSNRLPENKVMYVLKNFEKFYDRVPKMYDDKLIKEPVENWIAEQCTMYTGDELQSTQYINLNERLREYLINFQVNFDSGLEFPPLGVIIKQPRLHHDVEKKRQEVSQHKAEMLEKKAAHEVIITEENNLRAQRLAKAETKREEDKINAKKEIELAKSEAEKNKINEEALAEAAKIRAESEADTIRRLADAHKYASMQTAEANKLLYGGEEGYIKYLEFAAISNNTKIYFGDKIPAFMPQIS